MRLLVLGSGVACLFLAALPAVAGYPESPGMGCRPGFNKVNNGTWCVDLDRDSGYPESQGMGCFPGFVKVNNNTWCDRF